MTCNSFAKPSLAHVLPLIGQVVVNRDVANKDACLFDVMPRVCVELVRARKIFNKNVELAAREISRRMEELAEVNDQAWHLLSYLMLYLFPKGRGTEWGCGAEMTCNQGEARLGK